MSEKAAREPRAPNGVALPRLRALRTARFLTQDALAAQAGVARYTVRRIEAGAPARYGTALKLAEALGVPPEALTGGPEGEALAA